MSTESDVIGRYAHVTIDEIEHRIYYEECGQGIPLVCQHSAGADGRQWRYLLDDPDVTSHFRVIAIDLPYHGRSLPPTQIEWWKQEYKLTKNFVENTIIGFIDKLQLERPVFMGCLMGGNLALDLALDVPEKFRAVIGIEAMKKTQGDEIFRRHVYHPRVSNETKGALMFGVCSPLSPLEGRHEVAWVYSQSAPPVMRGDLAYYMLEHDLREKTSEIDTTKVAVYVLSGEYGSGSPSASLELSREIKGSHFIQMEKLGNFPMSENYPVFKNYIVPVLDEILL